MLHPASFYRSLTFFSVTSAIVTQHSWFTIASFLFQQKTNQCQFMCLWISSMTKPRLVKPIADTSRQMLDNDMNVTSAIVAQHSWCGCKNEVSFFQQTNTSWNHFMWLWILCSNIDDESQTQTNPRYLPANVRQWHKALTLHWQIEQNSRQSMI